MSRGKANSRLDTYGRRINYLRMSITDLCNLRCFYCMPNGVINKLNHKDVLSHEEMVEVAGAAAVVGIDKIRITGGEPLVKKNIVSLIERIAGIDGVENVVMTTNGIRLAEYAKELRKVGLKRINVSLDSLDAETFARITRGGELKKVIDGIDRALEVGFPIKINTVLLQDVNTDRLYDFIQFCKSRDIGVRFIERMGFNEQKPLFAEEDAVAQLAVGHDIKPTSFSLEHPHVRRFLCDGVRVGFISPMTHSFCSGCNKLRLTPEGQLRMCLASDDHVDMRSVLRRPHTQQDVEAAILSAIAQKPEAAPWNTPGQMWKIGG